MSCDLLLDSENGDANHDERDADPFEEVHVFTGEKYERQGGNPDIGQRDDGVQAGKLTAFESDRDEKDVDGIANVAEQ